MEVIRLRRMNRRWRRSTGLVLLVLLCLAGAVEARTAHAASAERTAAKPSIGSLELSGVVLEEVATGSALAKAGLQAGDVLLSWRRLPSPPANPQEEHGEIASVFDWRWLVVEQAPRGGVELTGERAGESMVITVAMGSWASEVRPRLPASMLPGYLKGRELIAAGKLDEAADRWRGLGETPEETADWRLRCGLSLRMGEIWAQAREWERAQAALGSALEAAGDSRSRAAIWSALGSSHQRQNELEEATAAYRTALETWDEEAPDSLAVAASLNQLGDMASGRGDLEQADELLRRALALREKLAPESLEVAESLNALGWAAFKRGDLDRAEEDDGRALAIQEKIAPDSLDVARSLNHLGLAAHYRGDLSRATELHKRALALREELVPGSLDVAQSLNNLGLLVLSRGELDQAEEDLQRSLAIQEKLAPDSLDVAKSLNNLGLVAHQRGALDRAAEYYQRSLAIKMKLAPESLDVARSLVNLGKLVRDHGALDRAAEYAQVSLAIKEKLTPDSRSLGKPANVVRPQALDRAVEYYQRALTLREKVAPDSLEVACSLSDLGQVAREQGELDRAVEYHGRALALREKLAPDSLDVAASLNNLGDLARERGDLEVAAENYQRALAIQEELAPGSSREATTLDHLALLHRQAGRPAKALESYLRSLDALEAQIGKLGGSEAVKADFRAGHGSTYRGAVEVLLELDRPEEAFGILERSRARSFLALLSARDLSFGADIPEELDRTRRRLANLYDRTLYRMVGLSLTRDRETIDVLTQELRDLRWRYEQTLEAIRRASPQLAALQDPQPLDLQGARETLDPGTVLLSYSVGEERSDLFVVTRGGRLEVYPLVIGLESLKHDVELFRNLIQDPSPRPDRQSRLAHLGRQLYGTLIEPASAAIAAGERVLIAPDGPLHLLPFGALVRTPGADPSTPRQFLVEWRPLHFVLSSTVYGELKKARRAPADQGERPARVELAAFGDPRYPPSLSAAPGGPIGDVHLRSAVARGLFDFQPLPSSRWEVEQIAGLYADAAQTYLGREATEERVKSLEPGTRIVHFATHAHVDDRSPLSSAVVLTIPEELGEGRDNGLLQAWEIFERVRLDADLVVLSACETAVGPDQGGDGLLSLSRAFQYAGARSVVASLWKVADRVTAELMLRFYQRLAAGEAKDEALRGAQLSLIRDRLALTDGEGKPVGKDASAPYFWAGFQIYGDWR